MLQIFARIKSLLKFRTQQFTGYNQAEISRLTLDMITQATVLFLFELEHWVKVFGYSHHASIMLDVLTEKVYPQWFQKNLSDPSPMREAWSLPGYTMGGYVPTSLN